MELIDSLHFPASSSGLWDSEAVDIIGCLVLSSRLSNMEQVDMHATIPYDECYQASPKIPGRLGSAPAECMR